MAEATRIPGVYTQSGLDITDTMWSFLSVLRPRLGFDITVNSGRRSPARQAAAMLVKYQLGGINELFNTYSSYSHGEIRKMVEEYGPTAAGFQRAIEDQISRGFVISPHIRSDALDISVSGLSPAQIELLKAAAIASGAKKAIHEKTPPHVHIDGFGGGIIDYLPTVSKTQVALGLTGGAVAGGVLLYLLYRWKRRT